MDAHSQRVLIYVLWRKSETPILRRENTTRPASNVKTYKQQLRVTDKLKYLGRIFSQNSKIDEEITNRIQIVGDFYSAI